MIMVDKTMRELQIHGTPEMPIASYEWRAGLADDYRSECHWHSEWELFTLTSGRAQFSVDGGKHLIEPGDVVCIPGGQLHMSESVGDEPYRFRALVFSPAFLHLDAKDAAEIKYIKPLLSGALRLPAVLTAKQTGGSVTEGFNRVYRTVNNRPPLYELRCKAELLETLACWIENGQMRQDDAGKEHAGTADGIKRVITYIHDNYAAKLSVPALAEMASMSGGYFSREFRRVTAYAPIDYIITLRLNKASELLLRSGAKLLDIAMDTGFNNLSYFIRAFKARFGCSPTEYRRIY